MSKKNQKQNKKGNSKKNSRQKFRIPENVKKLAELNIKKFKKKNDFYDSKKELKKGYYDQIIELLPEGIKFVIKYGHMQDNQEVKDAICEKVCDPDFIKYLNKMIKKDDSLVEDLELLPAVIYEISREAARQIVEERKEAAKKEQEGQQPDAKTPEEKQVTVEEAFNLTDLTALSKLILKKKIKKLVKEGVDEAVAFDILSVIPSASILKKSPYYHLRNLFAVLYQHAKDNKAINFQMIVKKLFDKEDVKYIISFAMLEKRGKCVNFNDNQKKLFSDVTLFMLKKLEAMDKGDIVTILTAYIKLRKTAEQRGEDEKRRFFISEVSPETYPKITKAVAKVIKADEASKKYL